MAAATLRGLTTVRVAGVPEHFNAPFLLSRDRGLYKERGIDLQWLTTPQGTGKMGDMLAAGEVDMAVLVSEGAVANVCKGAANKIVGTYVRSPLRLGVYVKGGRKLSGIEELRGKTFGVSRMGSNSHLMSYVFGHQQGWEPSKDVPLRIIETLKGAQAAMASGDIDVFVWERFTTKHLVDSGEWDFVCELPSPWHPFLFVASEASLAKLSPELRTVIEVTQPICEEFKANEGESTFRYLAEHHGLDRTDAIDWLGSTQWACHTTVASETLEKTQAALQAIGVLETKRPAEQLLATSVCKLA